LLLGFNALLVCLHPSAIARPINFHLIGSQYHKDNVWLTIVEFLERLFERINIDALGAKNLRIEVESRNYAKSGLRI